MDKISTSIFYLIAFLITALMIVLNISMYADEEEVVVDDGAKHLPDYYIEGVKGVMFLETGEKGYELNSDRFVHFPDDNSALLDNPHIIQYLPEESPRIIWGENGWINGLGDELLLRNDVKIRQAPFEGKGGITADTSQFRVKLEGNEE